MEWLNSIFVLLAAIIGGACSYYGAKSSVNSQINSQESIFSRDIEEAKERYHRELKFQLLVDIMGNRHVITPGITGDITKNATEKSVFYPALNKIPVVFSDSELVLTHYDIYTDMVSEATDRITDRMYKMVVVMHQDIGIKEPDINDFMFPLKENIISNPDTQTSTNQST